MVSENLSGYHNTVQTLAAGTPVVSISGTINAYGSVGQYTAVIDGNLSAFHAYAAVLGPSSGHFTITNSGLIETKATAANLADLGILLGAAGTLRNSGTILGASGVAIFQSTGQSYVENSKLIEGSLGIGVIVFGNTSASATVVNSGTIMGSPTDDGGAIDIFGNGAVTNAAGGTLIADASYAIGGQAGAVSVTNSGAITGFFGGINLQGGGFVTNSGYIHATGMGVTLSNSSYVGINTDLGGTVFNSGTIIGQNGIDVHYGNGTISGAIQGYARNSGLIEAFSTNALNNNTLTTSGGGGVFGAGIILQMPGTVVNAGSITASNAGIYTENGLADVQNLQSGTIVSQIGIDLSANSATGTLLANVGYVQNLGTVQAYSSTDVNGNFSNGFPKIGVGVYLAAAGTVVNHGSIAGNHVGIEIENDPGTVTNAGTITSSRGYGVYLNVGGTVSNTGTIIGYQQGIFIESPASNQAPVNSVRSIANDGFVDATASIISTTVGSSTYSGLSTGLIVIGAGTIDNQANGLVEAKYGEGIFLDAADENYETGQLTPADGAIVNAGTVKAQYGVYFYGIGTVTNTGTIIGTNFGLKLANAAAAGSNSGLIEATAGSYVLAGSTVSGVGTAVVVKGGGNFTNTSTGTLAAAAGYGVYLAAGGSVNNAGSIIGYRDGIRAKNHPASIVNSGVVIATGGTFTTGGSGSGNGLPPGTYFSHGIELGNGRVTNTSSGTVTGQAGIVINGSNSGGYILNAGHVTATGHAGLYIKSGGTIINTGSVQGPKSGIELEGGGFVANSGIDRAKTGVYLAAGGTVQNSNIIAGTNFGIYDLNGISDIRNTGSITGTHVGVLAFSASSYVYNSGSIGSSNTTFTLDGEAGFATGIALLASGTVSNASAGVISGRIAVGIEGATGTTSTIINAGIVNGNYLGVSATDFTTLTNSHIIEALGTSLVTDNSNPFAGTGVVLSAGGSVTNEAGATITGYETGVYLNGSAGVERSVTNAGVIRGLGGTFGTAYASGIAMLNEGEVTNLAGGTISGLFGVYLASGTVTNAGTITETGPTGAAVYIAGSGEIVDDPGAVFGGIVAFGAGGGLELAAGGGEGTLDGFGTQFLGFVAVTVDNAAVWDIARATSLANYITLTNDGTLKETGADALTISGAVVGTGTIILDPTTITLDGSVAAGQDVSFTGNGDVLDLGDVGQFDGTINGFAAGNTIELAGISFTGTGGTYGTPDEDTYTVATAGTLSIDADGTVYDLAIAGLTAGQHNFVLGAGFAITETACYAAGTHIATAVGEMKVEELEIGDLVETLDGSLQKIKWIGRRSYAGRFIAGNKDVLPIRIAKGAIAENIPSRDLFVSPGHAICIDGALIHAFRLVNGVSITQCSSVESVTYYHIETENHTVIFAENCPAETFLDESFRAQFQNAAEFHALYPGHVANSSACLPLLEDGFVLHAVQQRVNARAGILPAPETHGVLRGYVDQPGPTICTGWAQDVDNPETPVCLDILVGGTRAAQVLANLYRADLRQAGLGSGCHAFRAALPAGLAGRLEVRRAADGAELGWTDSALARAA